MKIKSMISFLLFLSPAFLFAQIEKQVEMADMMRQSGKIYIVVGVLVIIFIGLIIYLISIDRKVKKLENKIINN